MLWDIHTDTTTISTMKTANGLKKLGFAQKDLLLWKSYDYCILLIINIIQKNPRIPPSPHNAPYLGIFCLASLCAKRTREKNEKWTARRRSGALSLQPHNKITTEGSNPSLSAVCVNDLFYQSSPEKIS